MGSLSWFWVVLYLNPGRREGHWPIAARDELIDLSKKLTQPAALLVAAVTTMWPKILGLARHLQACWGHMIGNPVAGSGP